MSLMGSHYPDPFLNDANNQLYNSPNLRYEHLRSNHPQHPDVSFHRVKCVLVLILLSANFFCLFAIPKLYLESYRFCLS